MRKDKTHSRLIEKLIAKLIEEEISLSIKGNLLKITINIVLAGHILEAFP